MLCVQKIRMNQMNGTSEHLCNLKRISAITSIFTHFNFLTELVKYYAIMLCKLSRLYICMLFRFMSNYQKEQVSLINKIKSRIRQELQTLHGSLISENQNM